MPANIDLLEPTRGLIDLNSYQDGNFGIDDYVLNFIFDDIILIEYRDLSDDGDAINRNGIFVPTNSVRTAWRKGEVVLVGPNVKYCKKGDIVIFPHDKGVSVANIDIEGYGKLSKGMFLNEQRLFGICKPKCKEQS